MSEAGDPSEQFHVLTCVSKTQGRRLAGQPGAPRAATVLGCSVPDRVSHHTCSTLLASAGCSVGACQLRGELHRRLFA